MDHSTREFLRELIGDSSMSISKEEVQLETVERCRVCLKGFKFRYGNIHKCFDHEGLEEVKMPPVMSEVKDPSPY